MIYTSNASEQILMKSLTLLKVFNLKIAQILMYSLLLTWRYKNNSSSIKWKYCIKVLCTWMEWGSILRVPNILMWTSSFLCKSNVLYFWKHCSLGEHYWIMQQLLHIISFYCYHQPLLVYVYSSHHTMPLFTRIEHFCVD